MSHHAFPEALPKQGLARKLLSEAIIMTHPKIPESLPKQVAKSAPRISIDHHAMHMTIMSFPRNTALVFCLLLSIFAPSSSFSATYYVATSGNDSAGGGSQQNPWRTIAYANAQVSPGDTVIVASGDYRSDGVQSLTTDGSSGNPITYYGSKRGAVVRGFSADGLDYVRFVAFSFDGQGLVQDNILLINSNFIEVWDCAFQNVTRQFIRTDSANNWIIADNDLNHIGSAFSRHVTVRGNNNLVTHNRFNGTYTDYIYFFGTGIIRNNYAHDPDPYTGGAQGHVDFIQTGTDATYPITNYLIEANFYTDNTATDHHHFSNLSNGGADFSNVLLRRNIAHGIGTGIHSIFQNYNGVYLIHESYLIASRDASEVNSLQAVWMSSTVENGRVMNSILYECWGANVTSPNGYYLEGSGAVNDYNLAYDPNGTATFAGQIAAQAHGVLNQNPLFVDFANDDFRVGPGSPAIGAAGPLTTVTSASSAGTTFTVGDAGFFRGDNPAISQYGGNLVVGDTITVGTDALTIASISGNNITVASSFTWSNGDPVYLGNDSTPDIGAYPYLPGGYNYVVQVTSHTNGQAVAGSQVVTATVTNPQVVRYVVFFLDGIPMAVANQSPYTWTWNPAGPTGTTYTVEARAYARYADSTLTRSAQVQVGVGTNVSGAVRYRVFQIAN